MKQQYLLPCECGRKLTIDLGQAGQRMTCQCGRALETPTLLGIRQLEPVETAAAAVAERAASWSLGQGVLFAAGLLLLVVGLGGAAVVGIQRAQLQTANPFGEQDRVLDQQIDLMPIDESWDLWRMFRYEGLAYQDTPPYVLARRRHERLSLYLYIALGIGSLGLAAVGSSFVLRPARRSGQAGT